jgi:hypothetical protein
MQVRHRKPWIEANRDLIVIPGSQEIADAFTTQREQIVGAGTRPIDSKQTLAHVFRLGKLPDLCQQRREQQKDARVTPGFRGQNPQGLDRIGEALVPYERERGFKSPRRLCHDGA